MADEKRKETDEELMERFDAFVRSTLLEEGNKLREEKGYPPLSETDLEDVTPMASPFSFSENTSLRIWKQRVLVTKIQRHTEVVFITSGRCFCVVEVRKCGRNHGPCPLPRNRCSRFITRT